MASALKWFYGVCSSGVAVACPVTLVHVNGQHGTSGQTEQTAPPAVVKKEEKKEETPKPPVQESLQVLIQEVIQKEKYDGCAILNNPRESALWFVCSKKENAHAPSFYRYKRSKNTRSPLMKVFSISSKQITFDDKSTESVRFAPFFWMSKFGIGTTLIPSTECNFKEDGGSEDNPTYTLTCKEKPVQTKIFFEKTPQSQTKGK